MRKTLIYGSCACVIGVVLALLALEIVLWFLPVRDPLEAQPVTHDEPYLHFKQNQTRVFSMGWNFEIVNHLRVNNFGFVNDQNYDPNATTPLLAVIGDSYVEAAHVPYNESLQGRLSSIIDGKGRAYSFAASGSPLSQYLAYAKFARERFRPNALAIVIVGNDFDESLPEYGASPGFHHLQRDGDSFELEVTPFEPSLVHRLLRRSALVRYVHGNGFVDAARRALKSLVWAPSPTFVGNVPADADPERVRKSKQVVDYFLTALPRYSGLPGDGIVLVVDAERPEVYDAKLLAAAQTSYFSQMRAYFIQQAGTLGYRVVDMQPRFATRHSHDGTRFEWPMDAHWNARGHEEAASGVVETGVLQRVFGVEHGSRRQ